MIRIINDIDLAVSELNLGNVIALPTETVYGLGADARNKCAVEKIFSIKSRPLTHPLIMHVGYAWDLSQWVERVPEYAASLAQAFWPGPLTMVFKLKKHTNLSPFITGGQDTIAIRCPAHPLTLELLNKFGHPIVAPSANPFGKISPTEAQHVLDDFPEASFHILDGGQCNIGIESTILDITNENKCVILRHGMIGKSDLDRYIDFLEPCDKKSDIRVSGNLKHHYQPTKPLFYFDSEITMSVDTKSDFFNKSYVLCFSDLFKGRELLYRFSSCPKQAAHEFYRQLRLADLSSADTILIELPPEKLEWEPVIDRIKKAGYCL